MGMRRHKGESAGGRRVAEAERRAGCDMQQAAAEAAAIGVAVIGVAVMVVVV